MSGDIFLELVSLNKHLLFCESSLGDGFHELPQLVLLILVSVSGVHWVDSELDAVKFVLDGLTFDLGFFCLELGDLALEILNVLLLFPVFGHVSLDSPEYVENGQRQEGDNDNTIDNLVLVLTQKSTMTGRLDWITWVENNGIDSIFLQSEREFIITGHVRNDFLGDNLPFHVIVHISLGQSEVKLTVGFLWNINSQ